MREKWIRMKDKKRQNYHFTNIIVCDYWKTKLLGFSCAFGPLRRCGSKNTSPHHWLICPLSPLCPLWEVTETKHKAGFHGAGAYLASQSMWDMPGNKGASLSPQAASEYPFHFAWFFLFDKFIVSFRGGGSWWAESLELDENEKSGYQLLPSG